MTTADILLTTGPTVEGRTIVRYLGVVLGEHVHSPGWLRGIADDVRHAFDDRQDEIDTDLLGGRAEALRELHRHAADLRAHAVVGVDVQVQSLRGGVVAMLAQGTAVLLDRPTAGGWVVEPPEADDHPVVAALREHGPATLGALSGTMDVDVDWLDATLASLEDAGLVEMDADGRWAPAEGG